MFYYTDILIGEFRIKKNLALLILFFLIGCNSQTSELTSIQGVRDPSNPFPTIISLSYPSNNTYVNTDALSFTVTFSEVVDVIGIPSLGIRTEQGILQANYIAGTGSTTLTFAIGIPPGVADANGIELVSPLKLNGGSIYDMDDDDDALLTFTPPDTSGILINAYTPRILTNLAPANGVYKENAVMDFTVTFDFEVNVTGTPRLPFRISGGTYYADYVPTADKKNLTFRYTVGPSLYDVGIDIFIGFLDLNGGTITDGFGENADLDLQVTAFAGVTIDSVKPSVSGNINIPVNGTFYPTHLMTFAVTYNEAVTIVSGAPRLALGFGTPGTRYATYVSGSGMNTLFFQYLVQAGDNEISGGFAVTYDQNGSVITDIPGNTQTNFAITVPSTLSVKADGISPTVATVTGPSIGTYAAGQTLSVSITFSESVVVSGGSPTIPVDIGGTTKSFTYSSGSGTSTLVFVYTLESGLLDNDNTGPLVTFPIVLGTAKIRDGASILSNEAVLTYANTSLPFVNIDSVSPTITSAVLINGQGTYKANDIIEVQITYSKSVFNTGSPTFGMLIKGVTIGATLFASTATTQTYRYTLAGLVDLDGIDFLGISLNGGTIKDSLNNPANLTLPASFLSQKVYTAPAELMYWFDVGDPLSATVVGGMMTSLNSKAETLTGILSGAAPTVTDDGVSYLAKFFPTTQFNYGNIDTDYIFIVYETPPTYVANSMLFTLGNNKLQLASNGDVLLATGGAGCPGCQHYNGSVWVNAVTILFSDTYLQSYVWAPSTKKIVGLKMEKAAASFRIGNNFENGEISEIIILQSNGAIAAQVLTDVSTYLQNKHGASY